jgi:hypothetical protein
VVGITSNMIKTALLLISAPLAALVCWLMLGQQFKEPDTLKLQFQSDRADFGELVWQKPGEQGRHETIISYGKGEDSTKATYPVTVTLEPIPSPSGQAQGNQVWLFDIQTDRQRSSGWESFKNKFPPWEPMVDTGISKRKAIVFPGGPTQPFTYTTVTENGQVVISLLSHAWSGGVRIDINGVSREFDLYGPGTVKLLRLAAPRSIDTITNLTVRDIPPDQPTLRWNLAEQSSMLKLTSVRITGSREWQWDASMEIPRLGPGAHVITHTADALLLSVDNPSAAWVEFNNLPVASRGVTSRHDLLMVLALTSLIWFGILLVFLWNIIDRIRGPWSTAIRALVPLAFFLAIVVPLTSRSNSITDEKAHITVEPVVQNLESPTGIAFQPDGSMFITEKGGFGDVATGRVKLLRPNSQTPETLLELPVCSNAERGLLGIALDPKFDANGYLYLYYTRQLDKCSTGPEGPNTPRNRVSRFTFADGKIAPTSEVVLVDGIPSVTSAHNAGGLRFGPDGMLYIGTGEGAAGENAQTLTNLGGKILRIRPDPANLVPDDNPFANARTL